MWIKSGKRGSLAPKRPHKLKVAKPQWRLAFYTPGPPCCVFSGCVASPAFPRAFPPTQKPRGVPAAWNRKIAGHARPPALQIIGKPCISVSRLPPPEPGAWSKSALVVWVVVGRLRSWGVPAGFVTLSNTRYPLTRRGRPIRRLCFVLGKCQKVTFPMTKRDIFLT